MDQKRSPLKNRPLRNPGQSLDEEIQRVLDDKALPYILALVVVWVFVMYEWFSVLNAIPRSPRLATLIALVLSIVAAFRLVAIKKNLKNLRLGRDGERAVGQFLEGLREGGARIFHDVQAGDFNLDHVVISSKGVFLIETKTVSKPRGIAKIVFDGEKLSVNGMEPDRNPILQAQAEASWLGQLLNESTGRHFPIQPVVVYPGWWIERANKKAPNLVWVLEPKALPKWIEQAPILLKPDEVALAAFHLSRYVRGFETVN